MKINENTQIWRNKQTGYWMLHLNSWWNPKTNEEIQIVKDLQHLSKVKSNEETIGQIMEDLISNLISKITDRELIELDTTEQELKLADNEMTKPYMRYNHLVRYLHDTGKKLTRLEIDTLECILSEGSFYEESAQYNEKTQEYYVEADRPTFIGWDIDEKELPGCRGALASLKKKGILDIVDDEVNGETMQAYYIHFTPDFVKDGYYHQLDIPAEYIKEAK